MKYKFNMIMLVMSFYEALNPADIEAKDVIHDVKKFLPDIELESIQFIYHGT